MVTLSQQRDEQLQQLNILNKEVMIMEQKNVKIQYQLEKYNKEDANMDKTINLLHQKLLQLNANLSAQKELREELEDKNCIKKNEYLTSLENAELDLVKLQSDLQVLIDEKAVLNEELNAARRESLSWEKKVIRIVLYFIMKLYIYFISLNIFFFFRYRLWKKQKKK